MSLHAAKPTPDLDRLERAYRDYMAAPLGQLNVTAQALQEAAAACGWCIRMPMGFKTWTEKLLADRLLAERLLADRP